MNYIRTSNALVVLSVLILSYGEFGFSQQARMMRPFQPLAMNRNKGSPVMCTHDSLIIYLDCRMCVCPRPNRIAKCFKKSCDLRTKDSGQCPQSVLRIDDGKDCSVVQRPSCKIDNDCPGPQLCCFDFCGSPKCTNPAPLDASTGLTVHGGRGYE